MRTKILITAMFIAVAGALLAGITPHRGIVSDTRAAYVDVDGQIKASAVTAVELGYLSGVTGTLAGGGSGSFIANSYGKGTNTLLVGPTTNTTKFVVDGENASVGTTYILDVSTTHTGSGDLYGILSRPQKTQTSNGNLIAIEGYLTSSQHTSDESQGYYALVGDNRAGAAGHTGTMNFGLWTIASGAALNASIYAAVGDSIFNDRVGIGLYNKEAGDQTLRGLPVLPSYPFHFLDRTNLVASEDATNHNFYLEKARGGAFTERGSVLYLKRNITNSTQEGRFITANDGTNDMFFVDRLGGGTFRGMTTVTHATASDNNLSIANTSATGFGVYSRGGGGGQYIASFRDRDDVTQLLVDSAGVTTTGGLKVGPGTMFTNVVSATAALDFGSIIAAASADLTITVAGAKANDGVQLGLPVDPDASLTFSAFVSSANTVTVRAFNIGAIAVDQASKTFRAVVTQF